MAKGTLIDLYITEWYRDLNNKDKLRTYKTIKKVRWLISAKQTLLFLTGLVNVQNYFCRHTKPFVRVRNLLYAYKTILYAYKTFCTHTKPFVRVQNLLYAYETFCTRTKPFVRIQKSFVRVQSLLYAYETLNIT